MDCTLTSLSKCEVRSKICFLIAEKCSALEIHKRLCVVYGETNIMALRNVQRRQKMFKEGRLNTHDGE